VTASHKPYGDEMSSYQTTSPRKAFWNPVIVPPTKIMNIPTPSLPVASSPPPSTTARWDWLLFSPEYYSELYTPSSTFVQKPEEEKDGNHDLNFFASLPRCLLALLCLTPKLIRTSDDENDSDQEIGSLHIPDEPLLSINPTDKKILNISSNLSLSSNTNPISNIDGQNRSSTPDTDDGYQSASDASRSDYSQQSSIPYDHHNSRDDITINEHSSLPPPLMPPRISYAAAVKPIIKTTTTTTVNKLSSLPTTIGKPKQIINNTLPTSTNDMLNTNGQKLKFIAPRFERMHHAKQYSSSSTTTTMTIKNPLSNRTQIRSTNNNQRNHVLNPTRRC
jgi:hypothetical protein